MKLFCIFIAVFLLAGICSVAALDLIVLKDGNMIESKVTEISPMEIRYKRLDNLNGPTIVIPAANVLSIRYENGIVEIVNAAPVRVENITPATRQESTQTKKPPIPPSTVKRPPPTAMDPDKLNFGINANPAGLLLSGPSICMEFTKENFNSEINLILPTGLLNRFSVGFGGLFTFNYFWHRENGGGYLGGGVGYAAYGAYYDYYSNGRLYNERYTAHSLATGINGGYKFVTSSGFYFRTGAFLGIDWGFAWNKGGSSFVYFKPDLAVGWTMR